MTDEELAALRTELAQIEKGTTEVLGEINEAEQLASDDEAFGMGPEGGSEIAQHERALAGQRGRIEMLERRKVSLADRIRAEEAERGRAADKAVNEDRWRDQVQKDRRQDLRGNLSLAISCLALIASLVFGVMKACETTTSQPIEEHRTRGR